MNINDILNIITTSTDVTNETAGTIIYIFVLFFITAVTCKKSLILTLLLIMPITLLFAKFKILNTEITALFCLLSVMGIALAAKQVIK